MYDLARSLRMTVARMEAEMDGDEFLDWLALTSLEADERKAGDLSAMVEQELTKARRE